MVICDCLKNCARVYLVATCCIICTQIYGTSICKCFHCQSINGGLDLYLGLDPLSSSFSATLEIVSFRPFLFCSEKREDNRVCLD